jgi:Zn-dependent protease with chaperone function
MSKLIYPSSPQVDILSFTKPSLHYRSQALKVILSILLFITCYFLVLILSVLLCILALSFSLKIISVLKGWVGLLIVLGVLFTTGMFFFFMIKFLFQVKKNEDNSRIELFEKDQPELFEFISRICAETKAPFPKKVVLSPHVNASVYYNSSFLSMFFPVRKNLEIGAGLLNSVNITEFKAVLAHEFGHFSQSSTRLGSYTYSFSRVTNNLLHENDSWLNTLNSLGSIHAILSLFSHLTVFMVKGAISLFAGVYSINHRNYMSLSREMEFHADTVAVSVTGSKPIISALHRVEFSTEAFNYTLRGIESYQEDKNIQISNFFQLHTRNLHYLAQENELLLEHGLPVINSDFIRNRSVVSRLKYKDVWGSHPSTEEREERAMKVELPSESITESPWILLRTPEKLQQELSEKLAMFSQNEGEKLVVGTPDMILHFSNLEEENKINPVYGTYYNYTSNTSSLPLHEDQEFLKKQSSEKIQALFSPEIIQNLKQYYSDINDTETMRLISSGHLSIKRFQFDGKTYTRYYSGDIYKQLKTDIEAQEKELNDHNRRISSWFYAKAQNTPLGETYFQHLQFSCHLNEDLKYVVELLDELVKFYNEHIVRYTSVEDIHYQSKKIHELYQAFYKLEEKSPERDIPEKLISSGLFNKGYKASIFCVEVRNPAELQGLAGLYPLFEDLKKITDNCATQEKKVRKQIIMLQDEILAKHSPGITES